MSLKDKEKYYGNYVPGKSFGSPTSSVCHPKPFSIPYEVVSARTSQDYNNLLDEEGIDKIDF